jgi:hypothetical protein
MPFAFAPGDAEEAATVPPLVRSWNVVLDANLHPTLYVRCRTAVAMRSSTVSSTASEVAKFRRT